ncbi:carboxypeptidase-like regulatory domain-containing protein [Mesonia ostreae]|uniref:Carboxypeptidase-like regulatory domain-containing protein n=1 Tax=Mesonia ostreae TaxID=861110 RepID=A0ABU2KLF4_9FLAO|nr:carboxypeptidase-like regulatory domain-containing protein [Mesonia ostreae]MDT0295548.1 carboxypeptidase-like regulatory domain-containing protein [Mesonia ostreae]
MQNKYALLFFSLLCLTGFSVSAQQLTGKLFSKETKESIPYAAVQIGENYGVITNNEGEFQINVDRFSANDSLYFSSMGFVEQKIALKDFQPKSSIYLKEDVSQLENVFLVNRNLSIEEIMTKVNENLDKNYTYSLKKFDIFSRKQSTTKVLDMEFEINKATFLDKSVRKDFNKSIDSLLNVNKNSTNTSYSESYTQIFIGSSLDSLKVDLQKVTQLKDETKAGDAEDFSSQVFEKIAKNLKSKNTFKVKSGLLPIDDSLEVGESFRVKENNDSLLTKDVKSTHARSMKHSANLHPGKLDFVEDFEAYDFTQEKITGYQGEMVYVLNFIPRKGRAKYHGTLYISSETFAVIKAEYELEEGEKAAGMNLKFLLGIKYRRNKNTGIVIFKKNAQNTYDPIYLKSSTQDYVYLNRSFKFKENTDDRSNRIKFKFDLLVENESYTNQELLIVKTEPITAETFNSFKEKEGVLIDKIKKYNAYIWKDYNIISPEKDLQEFEY